MLAIRVVQVGLLVSLVVLTAVAWPGEARAYYTWTVVTVESGDGGDHSSIAVDHNGDPMVSYYDWPTLALKFATCDMSDTGCDEAGDWTKVTVDSTTANVGHYTSIAVAPNGDPMISYQEATNLDLRFVWCDMSDTGCDETADWTDNIVTVDSTGLVGYHTSIAVDSNGDPMISYNDNGDPDYLKFATCDMSDPAGCDDTGDWTVVQVESGGLMGYTSIAVAPNGNPMISYRPANDLKFAWCDMTTDCDQAADWSGKTVVVDSEGDVGGFSSIAVDPNGDPMISYEDSTNFDVKFARCDMSATGNCNETSDWTPNITTVESTGDLDGPMSIAVNASGDPMVIYWRFPGDGPELKFATCDMDTGCDAEGDWWLRDVVDTLPSGPASWNSIALKANGDAIISYAGTLEVASPAACDTTLAADADASDMAITVNDMTGCAWPDYIVINEGEDTEECHQISDWAEGTLYLFGQLAYDHSSGEPVIQVGGCPSYPPGGTDRYRVTFTAGSLVIDAEDKCPSGCTFTGVATVVRGDPYWEVGRQCVDYHIESLTVTGTVAGEPVEINVGEDLIVPVSSGTICDGHATLDVYFEQQFEGVGSGSGGFTVAQDDNHLCSCCVTYPNCSPEEPERWSSIDCEAEVSDVPPNEVIYNCGPEYPICDCGTDDERGTVGSPDTGGGLLSLAPVGGVAEWPVATADSDQSAESSSGSGFNYTALGGALAAATAALAAGAWLARRRWAR